MPPSCSNGFAVSCRRACRFAASPPVAPPCFHAAAIAARAESSRAATRSRQTPGADAGRGRARLRNPRMDAAVDPHVSPPISTRATRCRRSIFPARSRIRPSSCSPPPWPRSRRRVPPTARICRRGCSRPASCRTRSSRASIYAGEAHASHLAGSYTVDDTYDLVSAAPADARTPCVSGAAGFSATAPAPARAARSRRSFSTTGSRAAAARCGSPNPTS